MSEQVVLPRRARQIDWGAERRLLAGSRDCSSLLFIRGGYAQAQGIRGFGSTYVAAALILVTPGFYLGREIAHGRISSSTIRKHAGEIDGVFGPNAHLLLSVNKTRWIDNGEIVAAPSDIESIEA